ncbi:MAG: hypothetical protein C0483_04540 [Pirellula sp.]|nr:hypothetical protein [Pirellula sp.]
MGAQAAPDRAVSDALPTTAAVEGPAVEAAGLGYTFAERAVPTLHDVTFTLPRGSFTVVAGPTGSGKSTLLRALAGLIPHQASGTMAGLVQICGRNTRTTAPADLAPTVGLIVQSPDDQICTSSVDAEIAFGLENLALPSEEIGRRIDGTLQRFGLHGFRYASPQTLSGGLRQRLVLAAVAAMRPLVLVCDEPLSQLDANAARSLLAELCRLRDDGVAIVMAEHRLEDVLPHADRLLVLDAGRLVADVVARDAVQVSAALKAARLEVLSVEPVPHVRASKNAASIVTLADVGFRYPTAPCDVWTNLTATIHDGECIALVGPNGVGKSTLLALLGGALRPTAGKITWHATEHRVAGTLVPQQVDLTLFSRTVRDELAFGPRQTDCHAATVAERVQLAAATFQLEALLDEPPQALSRGQRVRTALAAAFATSPSLLLLDEPTTGQDGPTVDLVMAALRRTVGTAHGPAAVLFSTHHLRTALHYADRIWIAGRDGWVIDADRAALERREVPR